MHIDAHTQYTMHTYIQDTQTQAHAHKNTHMQHTNTCSQIHTKHTFLNTHSYNHTHMHIYTNEVHTQLTHYSISSCSFTPYSYFSAFRIPLIDAQRLLWAMTIVFLSCPTLHELCDSLRFVTIGFCIPSSPPGSPPFSFTGSPLPHDFKCSFDKPFSLFSLLVSLRYACSLDFSWLMLSNSYL